MRDVELFRRPPFAVGDEVVVSRWSRKWRMRRRLVRLSYIAAGIALIVALNRAGVNDGAITVVAISIVTVAFMIVFLWAGARMGMKQMEAYEDGIIGTELRFPLGRKRFLLWREVDSVALEPEAEGPRRLRVVFGGGRCLRSVPGEFDEAQVSALGERLAKVHAAAEVGRPGATPGAGQAPPAPNDAGVP